MEPYRLASRLPAQAYKTYQVIAPISTHFRPATCSEVECRAHTQGWRTVIDEGTGMGQRQAHYIRKDSGRKFTEERTGLTMTTFVFEADQRCFTTHQVRLGLPEHYLVRDGDHRGNPLGTKPRRHTGPEEWLEDFSDHQDRITQAIEKG